MDDTLSICINNPVTNIDLDGLEGLFFGLNPGLLAFGNSSMAPRLAPIGEVARLAPENIAKAGGEIAGELIKTEGHHTIPQAWVGFFIKECD